MYKVYLNFENPAKLLRKHYLIHDYRNFFDSFVPYITLLKLGQKMLVHLYRFKVKNLIVQIYIHWSKIFEGFAE